MVDLHSKATSNLNSAILVSQADVFWVLINYTRHWLSCLEGWSIHVPIECEGVLEVGGPAAGL